MNTITIIGNVGNVGEARKIDNGSTVINFSLADNQGFGDRQKTVWWSLDVWDSCPDYSFVETYIKKGSAICVTADNAYLNEYTSNGESRTNLRARVLSVKFLPLGKKPDSGNNDDKPEKPEKPAPRRQTTRKSAPPAQQDSGDDDIPF